MINEAFYILTGKQLGKIPYPENAQTARETASEGMVLLKNDGTLPFRGKNIALYGVGAIDTIVCGSGSGVPILFQSERVWKMRVYRSAVFHISRDIGNIRSRFQEKGRNCPFLIRDGAVCARKRLNRSLMKKI